MNVSVGEIPLTQAAEGGVKGEEFLRGEENMSLLISHLSALIPTFFRGKPSEAVSEGGGAAQDNR